MLLRATVVSFISRSQYGFLGKKAVTSSGLSCFSGERGSIVCPFQSFKDQVREQMKQHLTGALRAHVNAHGFHILDSLRKRSPSSQAFKNHIKLVFNEKLYELKEDIEG